MFGGILILILHCFLFIFWVVQILGKCEFLNPGGSVKDRVAVKIIEEVNCFCSLSIKEKKNR